MTYIPQAFAKGTELVLSEDVAQETQLLFDGWTRVGPVTRPRSQVFAHLSDIDEAIANLELTGGTTSPHTHPTSDIVALTEFVEDTVAGMVVSGANVTLSYTDNGTGHGTIQVTATGGGDAEMMRDTVGAALVGLNGIGVAINDAGDTISISAPTLTAANVITALTNGSKLIGAGLIEATDKATARAVIDAASVADLADRALDTAVVKKAGSAQEVSATTTFSGTLAVSGDLQVPADSITADAIADLPSVTQEQIDTELASRFVTYTTGQSLPSGTGLKVPSFAVELGAPVAISQADLYAAAITAPAALSGGNSTNTVTMSRLNAAGTTLYAVISVDSINASAVGDAVLPSSFAVAGVTWSQVGTKVNSAGNIAAAVYRGTGTATSTTATVVVPGIVPDSIGVKIVEFTNLGAIRQTATPVAVGNVSQPSISFPAAVGTNTFGIAIVIQNSSGGTMDPPLDADGAVMTLVGTNVTVASPNPPTAIKMAVGKAKTPLQWNPSSGTGATTANKTLFAFEHDRLVA